MKKLVKFSGIAFLACLSLCACNKDKDSKPSTSRVVKYEISGNYSGKINIVYTTTNGSLQTQTLASVPWSKVLTVGATVPAVTLNASTASTSTVGVPGETITAKIYIGGQEKASGSSTAGADGRVNIPSIQFTY
jgi:hypothetical protein